MQLFSMKLHIFLILFIDIYKKAHAPNFHIIFEKSVPMLEPFWL